MINITIKAEFNEPLQNYINYGTIGLDKEPTKEAAILNLVTLDYEEYFKDVKNNHHGMFEDYNKAKRVGFICEQFPFQLYIPDFVEINKSKKIRTGREMKEFYQYDVDYFGNLPTQYTELDNDKLIKNGFTWWGCFMPRVDYKQGTVNTNKKLVAYIQLYRYMDLCWYELILGHGDFLKYGIMAYLHFNITKWLREKYPDINYLMYAEWGFGKGSYKGLQDWKRRLNFKPEYVMLRKDNK